MIQTDGIAVACVQQDKGQTPRLLKFSYSPVADSKQTQQVLQNLSKKNCSGHVPASTVLKPTDFTLLMVEEPSVPEAEMKQAIRWKIKDMLDYSIDDAVIDVFTIPGQKERGRTPMVYAVAARKAPVQQYISQLEDADLALEYIDIPELVQRNVASLLAEDQQGVALLSLGETSGLITLTHQSVLYLARSLEVGIRDLVPSDSSWVDDQPGSMNLEPGGMGQALLDNIVLEIQRSLDYYESHFAQPPINHLYIAPLARDIPGLQQHLDNNLGVRVHMLDLNDVLDCAEPISVQDQSHGFFAIGAALREIA